jgi:hypothetical protein
MPRPWPVIAFTLLAVAAMGGCAGTVAGHYTVTGMMPLARPGGVPDHLAEVRARDAVAAQEDAWGGLRQPAQAQAWRAAPDQFAAAY